MSSLLKGNTTEAVRRLPLHGAAACTSVHVSVDAAVASALRRWPPASVGAGAVLRSALCTPSRLSLPKVLPITEKAETRGGGDPGGGGPLQLLPAGGDPGGTKAHFVPDNCVEEDQRTELGGNVLDHLVKLL